MPITFCPACTQYECSQQFAVKNFPEGTFVAINQKIADPPGESCSDWDFYLVCRGHGLRGPTSGTATWTRACASSLRDRA